MKFSIEEIKELMSKMKETGLGELELQEGDYKLKLAAKKDRVVQTIATPASAAFVASAPPAQVSAETASPAEEAMEGTLLKAPIVGTYYSAPSPDKDPFVFVGKQVKKGEVLYIIESMKLMNEIQAECDGEVVKLLVKNGDPVEYDQPIMVIR